MVCELLSISFGATLSTLGPRSKTQSLAAEPAIALAMRDISPERGIPF